MYKVFILLFIIFVINFFLLGVKEHYKDIKNIPKINLCNSGDLLNNVNNKFLNQIRSECNKDSKTTSLGKYTTSSGYNHGQGTTSSGYNHGQGTTSSRYNHGQGTTSAATTSAATTSAATTSAATTSAQFKCQDSTTTKLELLKNNTGTNIYNLHEKDIDLYTKVTMNGVWGKEGSTIDNNYEWNDNGLESYGDIPSYIDPGSGGGYLYKNDGVVVIFFISCDTLYKFIKMPGYNVETFFSNIEQDPAAATTAAATTAAATTAAATTAPSIYVTKITNGVN